MTQPWCPYYSLSFLIYYPSCLFSNDSNNTPFMQNWWNVNGLTWRLLTPSFGFCIRTASLTMFWIENRIDQYFPQVKSFLPEESLQLSYTDTGCVDLLSLTKPFRSQVKKKVWKLYWFQFLCHPVVINEVHGMWVQVYHLMYFNYCKIGLILSHWFLCSAVQTSFDYIISFKSCWHSVRYKTLPEVPELELKWGWVETCEWEILFLFLRVQDHPPYLTHQDSWTRIQFIDACLSLWFFGSVVKRLEITEY